jgi:hypothetical protein
MNSEEKASKMGSNEEQYREALKQIKVLLLKVTENFEEGDDNVSHFFEDLYDVLDEVIPM